MLCSLALSIGCSGSPPSLRRRMYRGSHKETCGLHRSPRCPCQLRRLANWGRDLLTQLRTEPRNRQADEQTRTTVLISLRVYFSTI